MENKIVAILYTPGWNKTKNRLWMHMNHAVRKHGTAYATKILPWFWHVRHSIKGIIMKTLSKYSFAIAGTLLAVSSSANAVVTNWDYSVSSLFTFAEFTNGSTSNTPSSSLSWGTPISSGQSSLVISKSPATGSVDTYLGSTPPQASPYLGLSTSLTHNNHPITGNSLTAATLSNVITLDPTNPDNPALAPFNFQFNIAFVETPNTSGTCAVSSPTPCNDIFVLTGGLLNSSFDYDDGSGVSTYYVNIFPTSGGVLSTLSDAGCAAAGVANGCIGFSTVENGSTTLDFGFTISSQKLQPEPKDLPEPGSLALLGMGLTGLFAWRRKRT